VRVLVYEFLTGGGWKANGLGPLPPSLAREGEAMALAIAADLAALPAEVTLLCEAGGQAFAPAGCRSVEIGDADAERQTVERCAAEADWSVIVAPEFSGILAERCRWVVRAGGRLLGPGLPLVELAGDKHATAEWLRARGVPAPEGIALEPGNPLPREFVRPAVVKPRDGAGSQGVRFLAGPSAEGERLMLDVASRLERYCPGLAASVAWLCGPTEEVPLPPCRQTLSDESTFRYLGGALPLPRDLARRAVQISARAIAA
jgi:predicted ATP-grasp superfamily ATP-dependent carboligase